ncbi:MAG TPA: hypothetical protein VMM36_18325 [Opitutaceae bacterium]|nr:hypothetical protein [Opitutaceae bacterium]
MLRALPVLLAVIALLTGCERLVSDSATRLAYQIRDEARALRGSGATTVTFMHTPATWPDGLDGDYRIEIRSTPLDAPYRRSILTANSLDGPTRSGTTYHLNFVEVPADLVVRHRKDEPTLVTLELHDGKVLVTELR